MKRRLLVVAAFMLAVCSITSEAHAGRGIPIPIVWGQGEEMTEMGELPPEVSRSVAEEIGTQVTVAFLYERAHVFWLDLWTWNGRHVLHSGDKCWEPDSTGWQNMIGSEPSATYGKPIMYRIPLLPALLVVAIVGYAIRKRFFKTDQEKLEAIMNDRRYQRSLETLLGRHDHEESACAITTLDEQRFSRV